MVWLVTVLWKYVCIGGGLNMSHTVDSRQAVNRACRKRIVRTHDERGSIKVLQIVHIHRRR